MTRILLCGAATGALLLACAPAGAQELMATASAGTTVEELVVFGTDQARQVQVVSGAELSLEVPGASPLKLVERLPSVNLQAADPFGSYEWAARITIRGFNQSQLGFTWTTCRWGT
jgi:iron complex outermembrane recepter protein